MIAYRFQNLADHPHHGVLVQDNEPRPAVFLTPIQAKEAAPGPEACAEKRRLTIAHIQSVVADYYGISAEHMRTASRDHTHVFPRQMAMLLSRELTTASLPDIGHRFGGRHHTTVLHAIRKITARVEKDPTTEYEHGTLKAKLAA